MNQEKLTHPHFRVCIIMAYLPQSFKYYGLFRNASILDTVVNSYLSVHTKNGIYESTVNFYVIPINFKQHHLKKSGPA